MSNVNEDLAAIFEDLAHLLERKGDLIFKIRAYRRAAEIISDLPNLLDYSAQQGQDLMKVPGIGKAISGKIHEYITTGQMATYERLKAEFPDHEGIQGRLHIEIVDCTNYFRGKGLLPVDPAETPEVDAAPSKGGRSH